MEAVLGLVSVALLLLQILLIAHAILGWTAAFAGPSAPDSVRLRLTRGVGAVVEPMLAPIRRIVPPLRAGGMQIDLAFIIAFLAIGLVRALIS